MTRPLAILWTVAIVVACLVPGNELPEVTLLPFSPDKLVHLAMFLGFGGLWMAVDPRHWLRVAVAGAVLGIGIELVQGALPIGRSADPLDALADLVGLGLGIGLAAWTRRTA